MRPTTLRALLLAAAGLASAACADPRSRDGDVACPSWEDDVGARVTAACADCHGGDSPAGSYRLDSYLGLLGGGTDATPNAIAGDRDSLVVTTIAPATATGPHQGFGELHALLAGWVDDCDLAYLESPLHPGGIMNPHDDEFHGRELERRDWDFALCASCHGTDFAGTRAAPSCTTCHTSPGGPTACDTCHPAVPTSNAHPSHTARVGCESCHQVPATWDAPGHILVDGHADGAPAEVVFTGQAGHTIVPADRPGPPTYDPATTTCAGVYCHGDVLGPDGGGMNTRPRWTEDPPEPAPCSSCHGLPPPDHAQPSCQGCHPSPMTASHLDGVIDVGEGPGGCAGCHGNQDNAAPPRDLAGNTLTTAIGVGAHQAHLQALHRLSAPIGCENCHRVPVDVEDPGHLDTTVPAEVVPALGWDRTSQTCATAWCHGPARPLWTGTEPAYCGSCHGLPPLTPPHQASMPLSSCTTCHPSSVDGFGNIRITGGPGAPTSTHINGVVDAP